MTSPDPTAIGPQSTMSELLEVFPGAQRALFRQYHIGGCSSCGFQPGETLEAVCARQTGLVVSDVIEFLQSSHEQDQRVLMTPQELAALRKSGAPVRLLDIRPREEWDTARIEGAVLLSNPLMQEILSQWPRTDLVVVCDHQGRLGLDAAAYFQGHGFKNVRCLRGGLDAWSREIDPQIPRYRID